MSKNHDAYNVIDVGVDVLTTEMADNGTIGAQTGSAIDKSVSSNDCEIWGPIGYCARPSKPIAGKNACQAVSIAGADRDALIAFRDLRSQEVYGNLSPGDVCIYSAGADGSGQAKLNLRGDGAAVLSTTDDNTDAGSPQYLKIDKDKFEIRHKYGRITLDAQGLSIRLPNGAGILLGGVTPEFGAAVGLSTFCNINAQTINLNGICNLGPPVSEGGLPKMPAQISLIPPTAPFVPSTGVGVGAVTLLQTASTKVFIGA